MRLALFQPDIPQNVGAAIRLSACLNVGLDVIEPCTFPLDDRSMKRAALDYGPLAHLTRHASWAAFLAARPPGARLVLLTTRGDTRFPDIAFSPQDIILMGAESRGAPAEVHAAADVRLRIPLAPGARSLNVVTAATLALGEALRQIKAFPSDASASGAPLTEARTPP
jgi:tRNA (cytidine/uridine-2'-O-)-methyltransferase